MINNVVYHMYIGITQKKKKSLETNFCGLNQKCMTLTDQLSNVGLEFYTFILTRTLKRSFKFSPNDQFRRVESTLLTVAETV